MPLAGGSTSNSVSVGLLSLHGLTEIQFIQGICEDELCLDKYLKRKMLSDSNWGIRPSFLQIIYKSPAQILESRKSQID